MNITANSLFGSSQLAMQANMARTNATQNKDFEFSLDVDIGIEVEVSETEGIDADKPQTLDDVKKEFYDYLDSLSLSPGLSKTPISVNVTEKAFEKMLADPEYKQKMKDLCARDLCDPNWSTLPPSGINITIDADCSEEYIATSWSSSNGAKNVNSDGFWTRRTKKNESARKDMDRKAQEKREMMNFLQERADERKRMTKASAFSDIFGGQSDPSSYTSAFTSSFGGEVA